MLTYLVSRDIDLFLLIATGAKKKLTHVLSYSPFSLHDTYLNSKTEFLLESWRQWSQTKEPRTISAFWVRCNCAEKCYLRVLKWITAVQKGRAEALFKICGRLKFCMAAKPSLTGVNPLRSSACSICYCILLRIVSSLCKIKNLYAEEYAGSNWWLSISCYTG